MSLNVCVCVGGGGGGWSQPEPGQSRDQNRCQVHNRGEMSLDDVHQVRHVFLLIFFYTFLPEIELVTCLCDLDGLHITFI